MPSPLTHKPKYILIIRLSSLGDITHCLPVSYNLRKHYPQARIAWLVRERYKELLEMEACLDEIVEIKNISPRRLIARINEICRIINLLRRKKFDIVLDLHCVLITNIISIFSGSPLKFGIDKKNELGLKVLKYSPLSKNKKIHRVNAYLSILNLLGINTYEIKYNFVIPLKDSDRMFDLLKRYGHSSRKAVIAFHPGTAWEIKQWGIEKFAELSSILSIRYDTELVIIYGPKEKFFKQDKITGLFSPKAKFITCSGIKELAALLERCDLLIGNDSGPLHLAAALGIPTISIFGPSNHFVSAPFGDNHKIIRKNISCSPCYGTFSVKFMCKHRDQKCLQLLSVEDVLEETEPIVTDIINAKREKTLSNK